MKTAQQAAQNWSASAGRAQAAWTQGVESYTGDWAGATVSQEAALLTNFQLSVTQGRWRQGVLATGTSGWKQATTSKAGNFATGFTAGAQKQAAAAQKIMAALQNIVPNLPPRGTYEQNKVRATTLMDALHAQRGNLGAV